jgi:hypothetical protein
MYYDVTKVQPMDMLKLAVEFADGTRGEVEFKETHLYGVFDKLRDPKVFQAVSCNSGFVEWPGDVDLAPDAMYEAIKETGRWVLT